MGMKIVGRERRKLRIRKKVNGTPERPRMSVFRSARHIYAQVIDDRAAETLVVASTNEKDDKLAKTWNVDAAKAVGKRIAERALAKGVKQVVFDRGGYIYHGRVKALADAAREGGLEF